MNRFTDKVIWITGASSGIGEALAKAFAAEGAKLVLSARRTAELERVRDAIGGPDAPVSPRVALVPMDVADLDAVPGKAREALAAFGRIDMVVNNAGISQRSLAKDTTLDVDLRLMQVNYFGTVAVTKAVLPHMMARGTGHLVAVSSLVGKFGTPWRSAYAASKHALHGFFDSLRAELADTAIQVTLICPGFIRTDVSVNALTGDGTPLGTMDRAQAEGLDPDIAARRMLDGLARGDLEIYVGGRETRGVLIKRLFPNLFARWIAKARVR